MALAPAFMYASPVSIFSGVQMPLITYPGIFQASWHLSNCMLYYYVSMFYGSYFNNIQDRLKKALKWLYSTWSIILTYLRIYQSNHEPIQFGTIQEAYKIVEKQTNLVRISWYLRKIILSVLWSLAFQLLKLNTAF